MADAGTHHPPTSRNRLTNASIEIKDRRERPRCCSPKLFGRAAQQRSTASQQHHETANPTPPKFTPTQPPRHRPGQHADGTLPQEPAAAAAAAAAGSTSSTIPAPQGVAAAPARPAAPRPRPRCGARRAFLLLLPLLRGGRRAAVFGAAGAGDGAGDGAGRGAAAGGGGAGGSAGSAGDGRGGGAAEQKGAGAADQGEGGGGGPERGGIEGVGGAHAGAGACV